MTNCPKCKSKNIETHQDSVDIGVGVQEGPLYWMCHDCGATNDNYCSDHHKDFERIEDRSEHFEHENADPFGCPHCYINQIMEG